MVHLRLLFRSLAVVMAPPAVQTVCRVVERLQTRAAKVNCVCCNFWYWGEGDYLADKSRWMLP